MGNIVWKQAAIDDLDNIYDYIAQDSPTRAEDFINALVRQAKTLSEFPQLGLTRLPNFPELRLFPFKNYIFIYKPLNAKNGIELLRIFHGAQDYLTLFPQDP